MRYRSYQNQFILAAELDFVEPVSFKRKTTKWPFLGLTRQNLTTSRYEFSVAILSTKIPILLGHGFWHFTLPKLSGYGFLSMMHEARLAVLIDHRSWGVLGGRAAQRLPLG